MNEAEARELLAVRPPTTRTYAIEPGALERIRLDTAADLRRLTDDEVSELADYLGAAVADLGGDLRVVDARCPSCGRVLSFLDFARTAVERGLHDREELADVLTGRSGAWLTIRGEDGGRPVRCAGCGADARLSDGYSEYSSKTYAYA